MRNKRWISILSLLFAFIIAACNIYRVFWQEPAVIRQIIIQQDIKIVQPGYGPLGDSSRVVLDSLTFGKSPGSS